MKKKLSRQRIHQLKLRKEKPAVYYAQKSKREKKYRQSDHYKEYAREYMVRYRAKHCK